MNFRSLIVVALILPTGCSTREDAGEKDLRQLQGTWKVVSITNGNDGEVPPEIVRNMVISIEANKWKTFSGGQAMEETFKLHTAKNPKFIDLTRTPIVGVVSDGRNQDPPAVKADI